MKKKMICWMLLMTVAVLLPTLAMAEGAAGVVASAPVIDWTRMGKVCEAVAFAAGSDRCGENCGGGC
mgnify:CR=1 FL=1